MNPIINTIAQAPCKVINHEAALLQRELLGRGIDHTFSESFLLFRPKERLSGDFFWSCERDEYRYIAVGDCTGHGTRAAMMSMLCIGFLNNILAAGVFHPTDIMRELDQKIIQSFDPRAGSFVDNDWIEMSLVRINTRTNEMVINNAKRKAMVITRGIPVVVGGSAYAVGAWQMSESRNFPSLTYKLSPGDAIYLKSDGLQDQFDGHNAVKFGSARLCKHLAANHRLPFSRQKELLESALNDWLNGMPQSDDITVVGISV